MSEGPSVDRISVFYIFIFAIGVAPFGDYFGYILVSDVGLFLGRHLRRVLGPFRTI